MLHIPPKHILLTDQPVRTWLSKKGQEKKASFLGGSYLLTS